MSRTRSPGEGSIVQRKDGRWQASLQVNRQRRTVYGKTRSEAAAKLDALKAQVARAGLLPNPKGHTLGDLLDAWLEAKAPGWKPRTLTDYTSTCDRHLRPALGKLPLDKITPDRVARLCAKLQAADKHRTAQVVFLRLSQALALAVRWGWLAHNPCDRVDAPRYKARRKDMWSPEELRAYLDGTREHWLWPLWMVAVCSGCRLGELLTLTWEDVDLGAGTLTIAQAKTAAGVRTVTLPREGVAALRRQAEWALARGCAGSLVFTGERNGGHLCHSTVEHALHRECARLGLPDMTPHGLRHLHASLLLSEGLPVPEVSRRLGHASPGITMTVYAHALRADDAAATAAIGKVLER